MAPPALPRDALKELLEKYRPAFERVLGQRAPQFASSIIQVVNSSRQLKQCTPPSVVAAAMTAAVLDLPLDKNLGFAHIVPYKDMATFQIGYKGLIQLALRSGQYKKMNAKAINADAFGGYDEVGDPVIHWDKLDETKPEVGYAFAWQLVGGFTKAIYWPKEKVLDHAKRFSQAYRADKKDSPWFTNFRQMGLKTVIKDGISHWGIMSVQLQKAIVEDQGAHRDVDSEIVYPDNADFEPVDMVKPMELVDGPVDGPQAETTPEKPRMTPQGELWAFIRENGFSFDVFQKWGIESGNVPGADTMATFDDVPEKVAVRLLRAKAGLIDGLKRTV